MSPKHAVTQTRHAMKTHHETDHVTKTNMLARLIKPRKRTTLPKHSTSRTPRPSPRIKKKRTELAPPSSEIKTKALKTTSTKTKQKKVKGTAVTAAPGVQDPSLFELSPNFVCHLNQNRHLQCFSTNKNAVKYDRVSNKTFKKCVKNETKRIDYHMSGPARYFADRDDKVRGVACAMKGIGPMCWGTRSMELLSTRS